MFTFFVNTQGKRSSPWQLYSRKRLERSLHAIFPFVGQLRSLSPNPAICDLFYIHQKSRLCPVSRVDGEDLELDLSIVLLFVSHAVQQANMQDRALIDVCDATPCITSSSDLCHQRLLCRLPACQKQPLLPEKKRKRERVVSSSQTLYFVYTIDHVMKLLLQKGQNIDPFLQAFLSSTVEPTKRKPLPK